MRPELLLSDTVVLVATDGSERPSGLLLECYVLPDGTRAALTP